MQGAQTLRSETHLQVRRNDEVAAQRRRWTFYEVISIGCLEKCIALTFAPERRMRLKISAAPGREGEGS